MPAEVPAVRRSGGPRTETAGPAAMEVAAVQVARAARAARVQPVQAGYLVVMEARVVRVELLARAAAEAASYWPA